MTLSPSSSKRQPGLEPTGRRWPDTRSDAAIEEEIWDGIHKDRSFGVQYQENLNVQAAEGQVLLRGHVLQPWHTPLLINIARRVDGVAGVESRLVPDSRVQQQVILALRHNEVTAPYVFTVRVRFGWIHLGGLVPDREIARAAETVAAQVPLGRGVLSLPDVFGQPWLVASEPDLPRRTLQPPLAAVVCADGEDGQPAAAGLVSQVVLDPASRLVSAIAVRPNQPGPGETADHLVPISDIEAVSAGRVWLQEGRQLAHFPPFDRKSCPPAPANWQPPFPYEPGTVRWNLS